MAFRGQQLHAAVEAMVDAFPNRNRLAQLLEFRLEKRLDDLVGSGGMRETVFALFGEANAEGWEVQLILAGRASNPGNPKLLAFAQQLGAAPAVDPNLERWVRESNAILDLPWWLKRLGEIESRVCRVEAGNAFGTGVLVGSDLILTNHHVVRDSVASKIVARFDYKRVNGLESIGTTVSAAAIVEFSPPSPTDGVSPLELPDENQLDFALVRLTKPVGQLPIGENPEPAAAIRGWIAPQPSEFVAGSPVYIVQHPRAAPISLALDTAGMIGLNANGTRVRYRTNTEPGSSGSPCFDQQWNLIAIHQSSDPDPTRASFNQGIPLRAITEFLRHRRIELRAFAGD